MKKLNLNAIRLDGNTQARVSLNEQTVGEYAETLESLPPVIVFHDGSDYWLADGFHRYFAHKQAGKASIACDVQDGTRLDAVLFAVGANRHHGLRRTNEDKRKAVQMLLAEDQCKSWSDRKIAEACAVGHPMVAALRRPEVAEKQQENRASSAAKKAAKVESDSNHAGKTDIESVESDSTQPLKKQAAEVVAVPTEQPPRKSGADLKHIVTEPAGAPAAPENDVDPVAELEKAHAEIQKLTAEIEAAEADDLKKEAIRWRRAYEHAERQQAEAMERATKERRMHEKKHKQLMRCGRAVGEADPDKVPAAVEAFVRKHSEVAA